MIIRCQKYLTQTAQAAPLSVFRILFGLTMFIGMIRFQYNGWIKKLYIAPDLFFSYYGFSWVKPLGNFTYLLFIFCGLSAFFIAVGYRYKIASVGFFLSFTYIELMDKTTYLNHYYLVSLLSFILMFLPAHAYYSADAWRKPEKSFQKIPRWSIDTIKLMLCIVYFYAGLAKLNSDWLFRAEPLKTWLTKHYDFPFIGIYFQQSWMPYTMSWVSAVFDLSIPFLLLNKKTRPWAVIVAVVFHLFTGILFQIGIFPVIMIFSVLIFFDAKIHHKILNSLSKILNINKNNFDNKKHFKQLSTNIPKLKLIILTVFFILQLLVPFRYLLYPGELFWTEEGFRFSWRVMLVEKKGEAEFKIVNPKTGNYFYVNNRDFLTSFQRQQMSTQADFILQYAHYLNRYYRKKTGAENLQVYVNNYVSLNGRKAQQFVNPTVNLAKIRETLCHKNWLLPFEGKITGL